MFQVEKEKRQEGGVGRRRRERLSFPSSTSQSTQVRTIQAEPQQSQHLFSSLQMQEWGRWTHYTHRGTLSTASLQWVEVGVSPTHILPLPYTEKKNAELLFSRVDRTCWSVADGGLQEYSVLFTRPVTKPVAEENRG